MAHPSRPVCLHNPTARTWPCEKPFVADLLLWLRSLHWTDDTVSFIELALNFEEYAERTLPAAPQAKFQGHTLPYHCKRGPRYYAWCYAHYRSWSNRALSTPPKSSRAPRRWCPWAARLWRASIDARILHAPAMHKHIQHLASYCKSTWTQRTHTRTNAPTHHTCIATGGLSKKSRKRACSVRLRAA